MVVKTQWQAIDDPYEDIYVPFGESLTEPGQSMPIGEMIEAFRAGQPVQAKSHYYDINEDIPDDVAIELAPDDEPDELIRMQNLKREIEANKREKENARRNKDEAVTSSPVPVPTLVPSSTPPA